MCSEQYLWLVLVCDRNPQAALAPPEMAAKALWADCWEGVPSPGLRFFYYYYYLKYFLSAFRTDVSWAWRCDGRGFSLTPPFSPEVLPWASRSPWRLQPHPSLCRAAAGRAAPAELLMSFPICFLNVKYHSREEKGWRERGERRPFANSSLRSGPAPWLSLKIGSSNDARFNLRSAVSAPEPGWYFTMPIVLHLKTEKKAK